MKDYNGKPELSINEIAAKQKELAEMKEQYEIKTASLLSTGYNTVQIVENEDCTIVKSCHAFNDISDTDIQELLAFYNKDRFTVCVDEGGICFKLFSNDQLEVKNQNAELADIEEAY